MVIWPLWRYWRALVWWGFVVHIFHRFQIQLETLNDLIMFILFHITQIDLDVSEVLIQIFTSYWHWEHWAVLRRLTIFIIFLLAILIFHSTIKESVIGICLLSLFQPRMTFASWILFTILNWFLWWKPCLWPLLYSRFGSHTWNLSLNVRKLRIRNTTTNFLATVWFIQITTDLA